MSFTAAKRYAIALFSLLPLLASGCSTTVRLGLKNNEDYPQIAQITVKDGKGGVTRKMTQRVEVNELKLVPEFEVKRGGGYEVASSVAGSGTVYRETRVVAGKPDPLEVTTELKHQAGEFINDPGSFYALMVAFKALCAEPGAYPTDLDEALRGRLGTFVIIGEEGSTSREVFSLRSSPADRPKSEEAVFASAREAGNTVISGSGLIAAKAFLPPFAYWGFSISPIGIYRVGWNFEDFGAITVKRQESNYIDSFNALSDQTKSQIMDILFSNKGARLYYVSGVYGAQGVQISLQEANKVAAGTDVMPGDYLTNNGAYSFSSSPLRIVRYRRAALYFVADEIALVYSESKTTEGMLTLGQNAEPIPLQSTTYTVTAYPTGRSRILLPDTLSGRPARPESEVRTP